MTNIGSVAPPLAHFNGTRWEQLDEPSISMYDVWASGPDDVWMSGIDGLYRYDGASWAVDMERRGWLWGTGADDVWVGMGWRYDGDSWTEFVVPSAASQLRNVRSVAGGPVWAWGALVQYRLDLDSGTWGEVAPPPAQANQVEWDNADNEVRWADFYPTKHGLWAVGYSYVLPERAPAELSTYPVRGYVYYFDGESWTDATPDGMRDVTPSVLWIAPEHQ